MGQPDTSAEPIDLPGLGVTMWADDEFIGKDLPENSFASILMHAFLGHSQRLEGAVVFTRYTEDGSLASLAEDDVYYLSMLLCRIDQLTVA